MTSGQEAKPGTSRRSLLTALIVLGGVAGGWQLWVRRPRGFDFQPIEGLPGWRRIEFEGLSTPSGDPSGAAFIGIGASEAPPPLPPGALCRVLFGSVAGDRFPIAVFSDFNCPFCRTLVPRLAERAASDPTIAIRWHELPLLGPVSEQAARAALAADMQGGYAAFQSRLMATPFRPTGAHLSEIAIAAGLKPGQLLIDMDAPEVRRRLRESRAAARRLGVYGTPGMVVGRTLVMGEITERELDRLIAIERELGPPPC